MARPKSDFVKIFNEHKDELVEIIEAGGTVNDCAAALGFKKTFFYDGLKEHSELADVIQKARRKPIKQIHSALLKAALGYDVPIVKTVTTTDKEGHVTEVTTETVLHQPPNMRAAEMFLRGHDEDYRDSDLFVRKAKEKELKLREKELELKERKAQEDEWK